MTDCHGLLLYDAKEENVSDWGSLVNNQGIMINHVSKLFFSSFKIIRIDFLLSILFQKDNVLISRWNGA